MANEQRGSDILLQEFKETIKSEAYTLIKTEFFQRFLQIDKLIENLRSEDMWRLQPNINTSLPPPASRGTIHLPGPTTRLYATSSRMYSSHHRLEPSSSTISYNPVPTDTNIHTFLQIIKPHLITFIMDTRVIKLFLSVIEGWNTETHSSDDEKDDTKRDGTKTDETQPDGTITKETQTEKMEIEKIQDFQEFFLKLIESIENATKSHFAETSSCFFERAEIIKRVSKNPHVGDYRSALNDLDERFYHNFYKTICDLRIFYSGFHNFAQANMKWLFGSQAVDNTNENSE